MTNRVFTTAAAAVVFSLSAASAFGQTKGQAFTVSHTWYDQPDLEGIWRPAKGVDNLEKGGFIKDPSNGKIPYAAGGAHQRDQIAKNAKTTDLVNRCYMPGTPRLM